jgi:hypothetical protein
MRTGRRRQRSSWPESSAAAILRAAKPTGVREVEGDGGKAGTDPAQFDGDDAGAAADI